MSGQTFRMVTKKGIVAVDPGRITVRHPLLKEPIEISSDAVAHVVHLQVVEVPSVLFHGDPVALKLAPRSTDANVALVLRRPVAIGKFKLGAEQTLPLTKRQRSKGAEASVLYLTMQDPAGLVGAVAGLGVRTSESIVEALRDTFGEASHDEVAEAKRRAEKARRRALAYFGIATLGFPPLSAARLHQSETPFPTSEVVREVLWAYAVIAMVAAVAAVVRLPPPRTTPRPVKTPPSAGMRLLPLVMVVGIVGLVVGGIALHRASDAPLAITLAPGLAAPSAIFAWFLVRSVRLRRRAQAAELGAGG